MTAASLLALDLGNSRLKACLLPTWSGAPSAVLGERSELDAWLDGFPPPAAVVLGSVADAERTDALVERLTARGLTPTVDPDCGLVLDLETPETTGRDRLYAARAAVDLLGACLVVDAGTALTVDAVEPGVFRGGAIAPGPALLARALSAGGARLPAFEPAPAVRALGRSTADALRAGVGVGLEGAALRLVERVGEEAGLPSDAPVALTGGAAAWVAPALERTLRPVLLDPWLVLRGLARALDR